MNPLSWKVLDRLLRGRLEKSDEPGLASHLLTWQVTLAAGYGLCLGLFALSARDHPEWRFMLGAAFKLPVLILGATLVTFPSLYVFMALLDSPLRFRQTLGGMLAGNTVFAAVVASMGPIIGFFSLSSNSYPFILLLNVAICGLGGALGLRVVLKAFRQNDSPEPEPDTEQNLPLYEQKSPEEVAFTGSKMILGVWIALYVFVGTQLAWILRPFIGNPEAPFVWFRGKSGSFVDTVIRALGDYLGG